MDQEKKEIFFNQIKERRKEHGRSTRQVSDAIRIAPEFLKAIEEGRFEDLPEGYSKMFIKSYLKHLKLDSPENLNQLEELFLDSRESLILEEKSEQENAGNNFYIDRSQLRKLLSWFPAVLIIVLLCYFAIQFFTQAKKNKDEIKVISIKEALSTIDTVTVDSSKTEDHEIDSLKFEFTALSSVYMLAILDSNKTLRFNAKKKQKIKINVKEKLKIYLSDGSKMSLLFKDSVYSYLSEPGVQVLYMIFDKDGIKSKGLKKREEIPIKDTIPIILFN